jgi:signal transduction histidine kinase
VVLSTFIKGNSEPIVSAFEAFARTLMPAGVNMVASELRDHAQEMLTALVADMERSQTAAEQAKKSMGHGAAHALADSGHLHADARIRHGFTHAQLLAEFRALRASVLRLYEQTGGTDLGGVRRFNEAIDEALTESVTRYTAMTDLYRDQFVGILGHDLRNPLNSIAAGATLLTMTTETDPRSANVASRILRSAHRMGRLIDDLLDLTVTRLGGAIPVKRASFDLEQLCHEVILEAQAAHPGASVKFRSSGDLAGDWDRDRLAQVLSNLLGNAIRHGDGKDVTLEAHGSPGEVAITVHNCGTPIPPELQEAIFEPLVRHAAAGTGESTGIGLGLFIARAIVASHEGDISVTSSDGAGTTMRVRLPRAAAPRPVQGPLAAAAADDVMAGVAPPPAAHERATRS